MERKIEIRIYGAEVKCASCVHLPSALEMKEWVEAALERKYDTDMISITYIDIYQPINNEDNEYAQKIMNDELIYPLMVINNKEVIEGNPKITYITKVIDEMILSN